MCKPKDKITLCTCPENDAPGDAGPRIEWILSRQTGFSGMIGRAAMPSSELGNGLNMEKVLADLNSGNRFDFEYAPEESDSLTIREVPADASLYGRFLKLAYKDGAWHQGYPKITANWTNLAEGDLRSCSEKPIALKPKNVNELFVKLKTLEEHSRSAAANLLAEFPDWEGHMRVEEGIFIVDVPAPEGSRAGSLRIHSDHDSITVGFSAFRTAWPADGDGTDFPELVQFVLELVHDSKIFAVCSEGETWKWTLLLNDDDPLPEHDADQIVSLVSWSGNSDRDY